MTRLSCLTRRGLIRYFDTAGPVSAPTPPGRGTLVLLHAFPLHAAMWEPQLRRAPAGWRLIAPDLRGFGAPAEEALRPVFGAAPSVDDDASDVVALLDALGIESAVMGGLSMGGYVVFALLRLAAARCRGAVLADTRPDADTAEVRARRLAMLETLGREGPAGIVEQMLPGLLGETTRRDRPELAERVRALAGSNALEGIQWAVRRLMSRPDARPQLATISCPTLVIVGDEDELTPPSVAKEMSRQIPGAELQVIAAAGHLSSLEQPEQFCAVLERFLDRCAPST